MSAIELDQARLEEFSGRMVGFTDVTTEHVEGDVFNVYYVARTG